MSGKGSARRPSAATGMLACTTVRHIWSPGRKLCKCGKRRCPKPSYVLKAYGAGEREVPMFAVDLRLP